jgi:hypothetical protein
MSKVIVASGWGAGYPEGGGPRWVVLHYLAGLRALDVEGFWLDTLGQCANPAELAEQFHSECGPFGIEDRWAVLGDDRRVYGMSHRQLTALCNDCDLLINLCGALKDVELLRRIKRRAFFDLDPGFMQIWAQQWDMGLSAHNLHFTVGLNVGQPDFPIPLRGIAWQTFVPPVALEYWPAQADSPGGPFTTIGQWRGQYAEWRGEIYGPKADEFLKLADLPRRTAQPLELALLIHEAETNDIGKLRAGGWRLVDPHNAARGLVGFRSYIQQSRAEFSVAKAGYVKSRSGWFSDRTVCYLASGRPALVQDTGFSKFLPTGKGLLKFSAQEEALAGIAAINADYAGHCAAARQLAEERFAAPIVLQKILERAGRL